MKENNNIPSVRDASDSASRTFDSTPSPCTLPVVSSLSFVVVIVMSVSVVLVEHWKLDELRCSVLRSGPVRYF